MLSESGKDVISSYLDQMSQFQPEDSQSPSQAAYRVDEGYSEETKSHAGSESASRSETLPHEVGERYLEVQIPNWILGLAEPDRSGMSSFPCLLSRVLC